MFCRVSWSIRWVLAASGSAVVVQPAFAGAWTQESGERLEITTLSREVGDFGTLWRSDLLVQQGLDGGWGLHGKIVTQLSEDDARDDRTSFEAGVQRSFALGARSAFAVQASVLAADDVLDPDCSGTGYEARSAVGMSRRVFGREGFVNVEAAWRTRGSACERVLAEVAAGVEIAPRWRALTKIWSEDGGDARSVKSEVSMFRDFDKYSLGLGYRRELSGAYEESGIMVSLWARY